MEESPGWEVRRAQIRALLVRGEGIEAMKVIMLELRDFSSRDCVLASDIDTSIYYTNPAAFGLELQAVGAPEEDLIRFASILRERGAVFLSFDNLQRAARDLEAAVQLTRGRDAEVVEAARQVRGAEEKRRVPVTVLTGFLGAGKTTLLNYILRAKHGRRYAVIENEVGQIGIDNLLMEDPGMSTRTAEQVVLLNNGCLCCTVRTDLVDAVKQILARADVQDVNKAAAGGVGEAGKPVLDGIIIETTGLADPGPVCKTFYVDDELRSRTRIDGVLTLVDARYFLTQLRRQRSDGSVNESAQQVGFADKILLNKTDLVDPGSLREVMAEVRRMNRICPIVRCSLATQPDKVPLDELLSIESFSLDRVLQDVEEEAREPQAKRRRLDELGSGEGRGAGQNDHGRGEEGPLEERGRWLCLAGDHGGAHGHRHDRKDHQHDTGVATCAFVLEGAPLVIKRFQETMNSIRRDNAEDLYRYKGIVCVKEPSGVIKRAVLQGVHDLCQFEPRGIWPEDQPKKSQLVFIGRKLDERLFGRLLEYCKEGILDEEVAG